jgi:hypothetical protein
VVEEEPVLEEPVPEPELEKKDDDFWGSVSTKKDKKKKKGKNVDPEPIPEPVVEKINEPEVSLNPLNYLETSYHFNEIN